MGPFLILIWVARTDYRLGSVRGEPPGKISVCELNGRKVVGFKVTYINLGIGTNDDARIKTEDNARPI